MILSNLAPNLCLLSLWANEIQAMNHTVPFELEAHLILVHTVKDAIDFTWW